MTLSVIPDALVQRVTAHLEQFGTLARPVLWTGKSSIVVHFTTDLQVVSMDTRFEPLMLNWTQTFRSPDGAIYLNVPAAWRREGEGDVKAELTPLMRELLEHMADGYVAIQGRSEAVFGDRVYGFAANSLTGLIKRGLVDKLGDMERYVINPAGLAAINRPLIDPTAPIPANELENADEPHDDIGTGVDPEPANNLPDVQPADPYAWATPERHTEVQPISEKLLPLVLRPTKEDGVWLIEDATTEKTMRRGLNKFGVTILSVEEGESVDEDTEGEPYTIARFSLGKALETPFPSKRQTKPSADPNSIHAQYDALHSTLPAATQLLIQVNGDEWLAFQMDAMLLRRYAPLCRFSPQTVNQAGEQWDKLSIPAGMLDETVTNANEGGLTVALASIVRDEPGKLPVREVDEIHAPDQPVQYVGKEEPPTEWETEADADDEPLVEVAPIVAPVTAAPSEIEMTPALMAAKIRLHIHGALRLGLIESVTPMPHDGWFAVTFVHGLTEAFTVPALKTAYEVGDVWRSKRTVYVREQSTAPHGTAIEQAAAVLENLSSIGEVFADAKARMEAFIAPEPDPEPTTVLLDHDAGADLIATLRTEHTDLSEASLGITEFLLNVIARMRTTATVAAPF